MSQSRQPPSELEELLSQDPGQNIILHKLNIRDYGKLAQTCYSMAQFFTKPLLCYRSDKLAYYLAQVPNDITVQLILKNNLNLLQVVIDKVVLKWQTVFNVTPLQLIYGAKDREMCGTLAPFFEEKYGSKEAGENEMQRQISEMKNTHKPFCFKRIIQAISNELFNNGRDPATNKLILSPAILAAIKQFREDFDASQPKVIDKDMQFRWETLDELCNAYAAAAKQWEYDSNKCALLEDVALAWVFRYIPENGAQHFNQGLYYLLKNNYLQGNNSLDYVLTSKKPKPFMRMQTTCDGWNFYEALNRPSADFLLDSACVNVVWGKAAPERGDRIIASHSGMGLEFLQNFCREQMLSWKNLCNRDQVEKRFGM